MRPLTYWQLLLHLSFPSEDRPGISITTLTVGPTPPPPSSRHTYNGPWAHLPGSHYLHDHQVHFNKNHNMPCPSLMLLNEFSAYVDWSQPLRNPVPPHVATSVSSEPPCLLCLFEKWTSFLPPGFSTCSVLCNIPFSPAHPSSCSSCLTALQKHTRLFLHSLFLQKLLLQTLSILFSYLLVYLFVCTL